MKELRTLGVDLETTGALGWTYDIFKGRMHHIEFDPMIMCFSWGWYDRTKPMKKHRGKVHNEMVKIKFEDIVLKGGLKARNEEERIVRIAWKLLDEADEVMAFNGDRFDDKVLIAAFMRFRMGMPSPYNTIDPFKMSKVGRFVSHSLANLCRSLGIPGKAEITHSSTWRGVIDGDRKSKKLMKIYNDLDVVRMFDVFEIVFAYAKTKLKTNMSAFRNGAFCCPYCGSYSLQSRGAQTYGTGTFRWYYCNDCRRWPKERLADKEHDRAELV